MGDDIGIWNIGAYHRGMMAGRTPNLDELARQGMLFTDYYAEASCTAGRANFVTGQIPIRTGLTTVGQAGAASSQVKVRRSATKFSTSPKRRSARCGSAITSIASLISRRVGSAARSRLTGRS